MSTYDDFDGVFFSIQALRMYHPICQSKDVEFIVLDNNPDGNHGPVCKTFVESAVGGRYVEFKDKSSSFNKYKIVDYANGKYILIIDCHVLIESNGIDNLLKYYSDNPNCKNLVQGPLWYDALNDYATHFNPKWSGHMYGVWDKNKAAYEQGEPFEIPMQGMGLLYKRWIQGVWWRRRVYCRKV